MNERLTSPFWGSFIISWLVFNWRIIYVSIFVGEDKLEKVREGYTRIDYILDTCIDKWNLLFFPLMSTGFIILIIPFITTPAYWVTLKFNKWKNDLKNKVDGETLLSLEKSVQIREEIKNISKKYDALTKESEEEIKILKAEIETYQNLHEENKDLSQKNRELTGKITNLQSDNNRQKRENDNLKSRLENQYTDKEAIVSNTATRLYSNVNREDIHDIFKVLERGAILAENSPAVERFYRYKIAEKVKDYKNLNTSNYKLTELGEKVKADFYMNKF